MVRRTETSTRESSSSNQGLFAIVGDIIALSFRAVGALFSAIFQSKSMIESTSSSYTPRLFNAAEADVRSEALLVHSKTTVAPELLYANPRLFLLRHDKVSNYFDEYR